MTRSTMRHLLRRRLNETVADEWQDDELNDLLNEGLKQVQKEVLKIDRDAFIHEYTVDIVADQELYPKPAGFWWEVEVARLNDSSGKYEPLGRKPYRVAKKLAAGTQLVYAHLGRFFGLYPPPDTNQSNGLRIRFVPTLTISADNDSPEVHQDLHMAIVVSAWRHALPETGEPSAVARTEFQELISDLPLYHTKGGEPDSIELDGFRSAY